jgi:hypothetical protein
MTTETITSTSTSGTVDAVLDRLLDEELIFDPVSVGEFINHVPMALTAARRLGATDEQLETWFASMTRTRDFLIERGLPDWLAPERADVGARGSRVVIAEQLPHLVGAPGSQLFHAPIRLELGLDADHAGQVANALHNWGAHATPVEPAPQPAGNRSLPEVLAILRSELPNAHIPASDPAFRQVFDTLEVTDTLLDDVAHAVASAHAAQDNFFTLHLVTGTRAIRALAPLADDATRTELAVRTAHAAALVWLGTGGPKLSTDAELDAARAAAPDDWAEIGRAAIATRDAHVVKLAYACRLEFETTGDQLYAWLAAREARLPM